MDTLMSLVLLSACSCALSEPLSVAIKRRSEFGGMYASDYNQDYEPVTFVAIPLHKPVPVLQILSRAPLLEQKYNKQSKQRSYGQKIRPTKSYSHSSQSQETYEPSHYASSSPRYAISSQHSHRPQAYASSTSHTWYDWSNIDESDNKYPEPVRKYPRPTSEYPRPLGDQEHVVYVPTPSNEVLAHKYSRPFGKYPRPTNEYPRPTNEYPRPTSEYPRPTNEYARPDNEYLRPNSEEEHVILVPTPGYEETASKYSRPYTRYQRPTSKYPKSVGKYPRTINKYRKPISEEVEPVLLVPTPSNEEPVILLAKPNKYGGYTYSKPLTKKRTPPKKKEPIIIRVHKYRIIRER